MRPCQIDLKRYPLLAQAPVRRAVLINSDQICFREASPENDWLRTESTLRERLFVEEARSSPPTDDFRLLGDLGAEGVRQAFEK